MHTRGSGTHLRGSGTRPDRAPSSFSLGALASRRRFVFWSVSRQDAGAPSRSATRAGVPTSCFGETDYFVTEMRNVE